MNKFWDKMCEVLPYVWGLLWIGVITFGSSALLVLAIKWLLDAVGVL